MLNVEWGSQKCMRKIILYMTKYMATDSMIMNSTSLGMLQYSRETMSVWLVLMMVAGGWIKSTIHRSSIQYHVPLLTLS